MIGGGLLRPPLYAVCALAGVKVANSLRPPSAAVTGAAGKTYEGITGAIGRGDWGAAMGALTGGGKAVVGGAEAQIKANIITGIIGGCIVAALVDLVVL